MGGSDASSYNVSYSQRLFCPVREMRFLLNSKGDQTGRERLVVVEEMLRRCVAAGLL